MYKTTMDMDKGTKFDFGYTKSTLETMGFSTCEEGYRGFVRFFLLGKAYEVIRYRNYACLGTVFFITSQWELDAYLVACEELMESNPDIQGYFSPDSFEFRLRIWGRCSAIEEFSRFVRDSVTRLDILRDSLNTRVMSGVYTSVAPLFEGILTSRGLL